MAFLPSLLVLGVGFAPFDHAQVEVVSVFLGEFGALALGKLGAAGGVRQTQDA